MRRVAAGSLLALGLLAALATPALAHPLGNFSVNRYSRLEVGPERTTLRYVLDLAEIPTLQVLQAAGLPSDAPTAAVERAVLTARAAALAGAAELTIGSRRAVWEVRDASLRLPEGQAGLRTMRISLGLVAAIPARSGDPLGYRDRNEPGRSGWHEVVVRGVDGIVLTASTAPTEDRSDELRRYPADPMVAPSDVDRATAGIDVGSVVAPDATVAPMSAGRYAVDPAVERVTAFLRRGAGGDVLALLAALLVAASLGAIHGLGPGHGKALVGAYLVGSRGTALHALLLGATVTATHTAGVYALGLVTLVAAQYVLPERIYPLLGLASGLLVVGIGLGLARARLRSLRGGRGSEHPHHEHPHPHAHTHHADGTHDPVGLRSVLALGVSGGLLPCPTALVVLLAAISLHDVGLGMALVAAFSVGLATVLTSIGLLVVVGRRAMARWEVERRAASLTWLRLLPAVSAVAIALAGAVIALDALRGLA